MENTRMRIVDKETGRVTKECKDCGKPFSITAQHIDWILSRGLKEFERCSGCRARRRADAARRDSGD